MKPSPHPPQLAADHGRVQRLFGLLRKGADRIAQLEAELLSFRSWATGELISAEARQAAAEYQIQHLQACLAEAEARAQAAEDRLREVEGLQSWLGQMAARQAETKPSRLAA